MICPICDKEIQEGLTRYDSDAGTTWKDGSGLIRHTDLTSKQAAALGKKAKISKSDIAEADDLAQAAISVMVDPDDPRAEGLKILISKLSRSASKDASSALKAIELMLALYGEGKKQTTLSKPKDGETCPTCNRIMPSKLALSHGTREHVQRLLKRLLESG